LLHGDKRADGVVVHLRNVPILRFLCSLGRRLSQTWQEEATRPRRRTQWPSLFPSFCWEKSTILHLPTVEFARQLLPCSLSILYSVVSCDLVVLLSRVLNFLCAMSLDIDFVCAMSSDIDLPFASCTLSPDIDCACHSTFNLPCIMSLDNVRQLTRSATFDYSFVS
jgi:hypothetical protein